MTLLVAGAVAVAVFTVAAAAQAVTGFGMALVAVPLMSVVIDPVAAVVSTTMVSLVLTGWASVRERSSVQRPVAVRLIVAALIGMPGGLVLLARLDERLLKGLIAGVLLGVVALLLGNVRLPSGSLSQWASGGLSGAMLTSTGMNGPPVVLTMEALDLPPRQFRATLQAVFCVQDLVAVAGFAVLGYLTPVTAVAALAGVLAVPAGWAVGDRVFARMQPERFRAVVLSVLALTALVGLGAALT